MRGSKVRILWVLGGCCCGVVLVMLRSVSFVDGDPPCFCTPACTGGRNRTISDDGIPALWTAHSILTCPMSAYHYAIIRSILQHAQPTVFYLHVANSTQVKVTSSELGRKLNDEYPNVQVVSYTGPVVERPSFADIQKAVAPFASGVYVALSVFLQPTMRALLATERCGVDRQELVVLFHRDCPYTSVPSRVEEHYRDIVTSDPTNETAPAVAVSPSVYGRLKPYTMDSMVGADKHWNRVVERSLEATPHPQPVIPNIVHYVWFSQSGDWTMTFMQLISVLSNLNVNKVDTVFIHSNVPPTGPHWDWLRSHYGDRIQRRFSPTVDSIFGQQVTMVAHSSDVVRMRVLQQFGGMYFDWDAIALKSHQQLRHYDAVMGSDAPFSDALANGHIMFRSDSEFLRLYLNNYKQYDAGSWSKNSLVAPKTLFLQYPYLMKMPDKFLLSPRHDLLIRIYDESGVIAMDEYYAFHYVSPEPELHFKFGLNFNSVNQLTGTFGTMLRHVINHP